MSAAGDLRDHGHVVPDGRPRRDRPRVVGDGRPGVRSRTVRGDVVFEVPKDASGLQLEFDFEAFSFTSLDRVRIDLTQEASSIADLSQDPAVDVHGSGDSVERDGLTAQLKGFETTTQVDEFAQAAEGNEYTIVDVSGLDADRFDRGDALAETFYSA